LWLLLLTMAMTSISMNLPEVVKPMVGAISTLTPGQYDQRRRHKLPARRPAYRVKKFSPAPTAEAQRRGWKLPPGAIHYSAPYDVYGVSFFTPGQDLGVPDWAIHGCISTVNPARRWQKKSPAAAVQGISSWHCNSRCTRDVLSALADAS